MSRHKPLHICLAEMAKATSIKEAIQKFEKDKETVAATAEKADTCIPL